MENLTMRFKLNKAGKASSGQPIELIKLVVDELEAGLSVEGVFNKYGKIGRRSLQDWHLKYGTGKKVDWGDRRIASHVKQQALFELESGALTRAEVIKKYQISTSALKQWVQNKKLSVASVVNVASEATSMENTERQALLQQMNELKLKITALETMIDLAEQQYDFPIRKKFGTKQ